jgi:hypothetical protein
MNPFVLPVAMVVAFAFGWFAKSQFNDLNLQLAREARDDAEARLQTWMNRAADMAALLDYELESDDL